jgi:hypothetical protein
MGKTAWLPPRGAAGCSERNMPISYISLECHDYIMITSLRVILCMLCADYPPALPGDPVITSKSKVLDVV